MRVARLLACTAVLLVAACASGTGAGDVFDAPAADPAGDLPADVPLDLAPDVPPDVAPDAPADVPPDAPFDVPPPVQVLGLPLREDGVLYAGAAAVDITPVLEPGRPVWMAGFGDGRAAEGVHDPLWARALVLSRDREYVAFVVLDLVGLTAWRIGRAATTLAGEGFGPERLLVQSLHNHDGPDTVGMWGPTGWETGLDPAYQQRVEDAIADAVRQACASAVPARLRVASRTVSDLSPYLVSPRFGGRHPQHDRMRGLIADSRDPVVVDDAVTALGLFRLDGTAVATVAHVNNHVEVSQGGNLLSSDFAHPLRQLLESRFGGVGMLWLGAEGGLQTTWDVRFPEVDEGGALVFGTCDAAAVADPGDAACLGKEVGAPRVDADGYPVPAWSTDDRWRRVEVYGRLLGRVAADALDAAADEADPVLEVRHARHLLPLQNRFLELVATRVDPSLLDPLETFAREQYPDRPDILEGIADMKKLFEAVLLDTPPEELVTGPDCPEVASEGVAGCMPSRQWLWRLGPLGFATMPGEVFVEWWHGRPADAGAEWEDAAARGPGSTYFPQADPACAAVSWDICREGEPAGGCDCLRAHVAPYPVPAEAPVEAVRRALDVDYPRVLGVTGDMTGYMVPPADWVRVPLRPVEELFNVLNVEATLRYLDAQGDHYEETVAVGPAVVERCEATLGALAGP